MGPRSAKSSLQAHELYPFPYQSRFDYVKYNNHPLPQLSLGGLSYLTEACAFLVMWKGRLGAA
jgi:hypothetical protein